ncbi:hypothetical protein ACU4GH_20515 [Bradyrhizobium betae]
MNKPNTEKFNRALATITRGKEVVPADQEKLNKLLSPTFVFKDETVAKTFGGGELKGGPALIKAMIDANYRRFGCSSATELGKAGDGGTTLLFAFKTDADRKTLPIEDVVILKPFFEGNLVTRLIAYDEYDWITSVMDTKNYACGTTKVEKPPQEKVVGAAAQASSN